MAFTLCFLGGDLKQEEGDNDDIPEEDTAEVIIDKDHLRQMLGCTVMNSLLYY